MNADALRARLARLRYLEAHDGPHPAILTAKLRQQAERQSPDADPADLTPAGLVAALVFGDLEPEREAAFQAALLAVAPERWAADDPTRALVFGLAGVA